MDTKHRVSRPRKMTKMRIREKLKKLTRTRNKTTKKKKTMAGLTSPRAKKRVYQSEEAPFPVPIETITKKAASDGRWFYYTGHLATNCVFVKREGDIIFLYKMGFFGKGILSKSKPQHTKFEDSYQGLRKKNLPAKERHFQQQRFQQVRHQKYERHLLWQRQLAAQQQESQQTPQVDSAVAQKTSSKSSMKPDRVKETEDTSCASSDADDRQGSSSLSSYLNVVRKSGPCVKFAEDTNEMPSTSGVRYHDKVSSTYEASRSGSSEDKQESKSDLNPEGAPDVAMQEVDSGMSGTEGGGSGAQRGGRGRPQTRQREWMADDPLGNANSSTSVWVKPQDTVDDATTADDARTSDTENSGEEFVIANDDEEGGIAGNQKKTDGVKSTGKGGKTKKIVRKSDPFKIYEYLQLSFEEAFFLSFGLGCLSVLDEEGMPMPLIRMWRTFCFRQPNFLANYVVYHYLRSKGWVPKAGVKYGADFVLYKKGPPFYHASYSVLVTMIDEHSSNQDGDKRFWNWGAVTGMNRITENVAKELMVCYVLKPAGIQEAELSSPKCLERFQVQEVVMKRWVSSRERENRDNVPLIS